MFGNSLENRLLSMSGDRAAAIYFYSRGSLGLRVYILPSRDDMPRKFILCPLETDQHVVLFIYLIFLYNKRTVLDILLLRPHCSMGLDFYE